VTAVARQVHPISEDAQGGLVNEPLSPLCAEPPHPGRPAPPTGLQTRTAARGGFSILRPKSEPDGHGRGTGVDCFEASVRGTSTSLTD
jgi:hypothetical protein